MGKRRYTDEELRNAVKNSFSIRETLQRINLRPAGSNYKVFKENVKALNIDISHFSGQAHLKGKTHNWAKKIPTNEILVNNPNFKGTTNKLKLRLIKEGYFERKCYCCGGTSWRDKEIPLELEHINGNSKDNRIENLTLLCPNCHAQTETYRGKNANHSNRVKKLYYCSSCGKEINKCKTGLCTKCVKELFKKHI